MEKSQTDFVQECLAEIAALKERIAALEEKLGTYEEVPDDTPVDFTDMDMKEEVPAPAVQDVVVPASSEDLPSEEPATPVIPAPDDETANLPWRKDKPGLRVKNIRSGISLYDRALFIGTLFKEDYSLYENTIRDLNEFVSLDQAVDYIRKHFPQWNLHSDVVYNFMMSIRKKLG